MNQLKTLLRNLDGARKARLEMVSGRRPRLLFDADEGGRGDVKNLGDEALTEDDVVEACVAAGAGSRLDGLARGPATWTYVDTIGAFRVSVEMRGREVAATFVLRPPSTGARKLTQPNKPRRADTPPARKRTIPPGNPVHRPPNPSPRKATLSHQPLRHDRGGPRVDLRHDAPPSKRDAQTAANIPRARAAEIDKPSAPASTRSPTPPPVRAPALTRSPTPAPLRAAPAPAPAPAAGPAARGPATAPAHAAARAVAAPAPASAIPAPSLERVMWPRDRSPLAHLTAVLSEARTANASDVHLVARSRPVLRKNGLLETANATVPAGESEAAILALVPEALREVWERDGGATFALELPKVGRVRANITRTLRGTKAAIRLIPREVPTLDSLGLPPELANATHQHQGLIVISGPSGHGKTTTLAALVDHINDTSPCHIITVEDPIEVLHKEKRAILTQREIGPHAKSFARALKGALRQDPDVIVVGELRDTETVRMALSASETGHLVLGTMNTPSAAATIETLIDLFPPDDQPQVRATLAGGLKYIVSQRLVPKADGTGRVAALETLPGILPLWNLIRDQKTFQLPSLMQRGKGLGIVRLDDSLAELVADGTIDRDAAIAVSSTFEDSDASLRESSHRGEPPPEERGSLLERAGAFFTKRGGA